jgi:DNA-binding response OmpR family regulator
MHTNYAEEQQAPKALHRMALIIEDNQDLLELLAQALRYEGYYPILCRTAEQALEPVEGADLQLAGISTVTPDEIYIVLRSLLVEVIIIDIMLPGMNGVAFVAELERRGRRNAPIMVISGHHKAEVVAAEMHAESFLQKPFKIGEFVKELERIVTQSEAAKRAASLL